MSQMKPGKYVLEQVENLGTQKNLVTSHFNRQIVLLEGRKEMFYLATNSTHFIYGYMASDIW